MDTMLMTNDSLTITRMKVISRRTQSTFLSGAKTMMVESLKRQMRNGVAHFIYQKKNGEIREAWGTTNASLAAKYTNGCGLSRENYFTMAYFDVEKSGWRSFRWENIISVF